MANISDARCTCPEYWQGKEPRPLCLTHEACPERSEGIHCDCWYDGAQCCACGMD